MSLFNNVTLMYAQVIRKSLVCTRMSPVCHSYALVCHSYVTRMYSYVIRMSLVCGFTMNPFKLLVILPFIIVDDLKGVLIF